MIPKTIQTVLYFANGNLAAFDNSGAQVPELQISPLELWCRHAESLGYNPEGWIVETQVGKWRLFRCESGWNREVVR